MPQSQRHPAREQRSERGVRYLLCPPGLGNHYRPQIGDKGQEVCDVLGDGGLGLEDFLPMLCGNGHAVQLDLVAVTV